MKLAGFVLSALMIAGFAAPVQAAPASIAGNWKTDDGRAVVQFYKCGEATCGRIARFLVPEPAGGARDVENPEKSRRDRKILGLRIFWNLTPDGSKFEGKGYSPEDGRYFNANLQRSGNVLKVTGCVVVFCKSVNFTKI